MLDAKTQTPNKPEPAAKSAARDSNLLDNDNVASEAYKRNKKWYVPSDPLGIKYFEKTWYIATYYNTPLHIHITLPTYIICTLLYSMFHVEALSWFTIILLLLILQCMALALQIFVCLHIAKQFEARIHRILIWPYGYIGYATDYKQWTHFIIVEYAAPLVHIMIFVLFWGIAVILGIANWNYLSPIHRYFGQNLLNGIWVNNIIIASLHICIPVYSMKTARLMVNYLYRKRTHRDVAKIMLMPTAFMTIILLIFGIVDAQPLPLFLSLWSMYQTYLLVDGSRKNLVAKLPLFQNINVNSKKRSNEQEVQTQKMIEMDQQPPKKQELQTVNVQNELQAPPAVAEDV